MRLTESHDLPFADSLTPFATCPASVCTFAYKNSATPRISYATFGGGQGQVYRAAGILVR